MTGQASANVERLRSMEGCTRAEAARALNICEAYVARLAKINGIRIAENPSPSAAVIEDIKSLAASGFTMPESATELSISYQYLSILARKHSIKFVHAAAMLQPNQRERQMAALYRSGKTLNEVGQQYGITRERVRQLLTKFYGIRAPNGGQHKLSEERRIKFEAKRNAISLKRWGCNFDQYVLLRNMKKPTRAFNAQRQNAAKRNIGWELNLWEWWSIWQQCGKWSQRGRGQGYMMCRKGDLGPYAIDNVFIATGCENSSNQARKKNGLPIGVRKNKKYAGYTAYRQIKGKTLRLGSHPTPELAHAAYLMAGAAQ